MKISKTCYSCGELKLFKEFGKNKSKKDGLCTECKVCAVKNSTRARKKVTEIHGIDELRRRRSKEARDYYAKYKHLPDFVKKRRSSPENHRKTHLKKMYNMSLDDYEKMLLECHGVCSICKKPETSKPTVLKSTKLTRLLVVDHNHETGKIRGLLCDKCNRGLGYFKENIINLKEAIKYLKKHNENFK